jgi:hypothetical protein
MRLHTYASEHEKGYGEISRKFEAKSQGCKPIQRSIKRKIWNGLDCSLWTILRPLLLVPTSVSVRAL